MVNVTLIFDIGKTNKKCFLFNEDFEVVHQEEKVFPQIHDEDDHPTEDLRSLRYWIFDSVDQISQDEKYQIKAINFSTYGASLVHLDEEDRVISPMYNYTKEMPEGLIEEFLGKHGKVAFIETGSPSMGFLNAGLQLYWIKHRKPRIFKRIAHTLHFPQYLSALFTGRAVSELTSIGCHTAMWNHKLHQYHDWVHQEELVNKFPEIVPSDSYVERSIDGRIGRIGIGIHDSSAALLPYLLIEKKPFILLSTGTWSIGLNPFISLEKLEPDQQQLLYLNVFAKSVLASQLFLGREYAYQVEQMNSFFKKGKKKHRKVKFRSKWYKRCLKRDRPRFQFEFLKDDVTFKRKFKPWTKLKSYEYAYHRLMYELMKVQRQQLKLLIGQTQIKCLYVDGGFANNIHFVKILRLSFPKLKIHATEIPIGSALGAALVVNADRVDVEKLKKMYKAARR